MDEQQQLEAPDGMRTCGDCGSLIPAHLPDENCPACGEPPEPAPASAPPPDEEGEAASTPAEEPPQADADAGSAPPADQHTSGEPSADAEPDPELRCPECRRKLRRKGNRILGHRKECPQPRSVDPEPLEGDVETPQETIAAAAEEVLGPSTDIDLYKPEEIVVASSEDVYRAMDQADEEMILDELQERLTGVMVYSFSQDGQQITDLSYEGISECARTLNARGFTRMRVAKDVQPIVNEIREEGQDWIRVAVYVEDEKTGGGDWGVAVEPKKMQLRPDTAARWRKRPDKPDPDEHNRVWDKFALTKAMSKAKRNAYRSQIPLKLRQVLIAQFLKDPEKVRVLRAAAGGEAIAELPPALVTPEAEAKRVQAREIFTAIKAVHPTKYLLPGAFNALLMRHEHDLTRLDELLEHLNGILERAREDAAQEARA